jgi:V/A-type H+-transporting ATPase subunit A
MRELSPTAQSHQRALLPGDRPADLLAGYLDQLAGWYRRNIDPGWVEKVKSLQALLSAGDGIQQMMEVTGEEGVTTADYVTYQKALFLDMVFLQQDAFDEVDASTPTATPASCCC